MRIATPDRCVYGNTPELHLIAHKFSVNIAIFEVDPDNLHEYVMNSSIVVDPNNPKSLKADKLEEMFNLTVLKSNNKN